MRLWRIPASAAGGNLKALASFGLVAVTFTACDLAHPDQAWPGVATAEAVAPGAKIEVPPPPFSDGAFPCTECHDPAIEVNTTRRPMQTAHQEIVLHHDEQNRWCLDCHATQSRDKLHLANGELVDFTESYKLCGQCHGDKYRDWRAGVHGRRSGDWNGHKTYLLCVHCHSSHAPAFQPQQPMPVPVRPARLGQGKPQRQGGAK